MGILLNLSKYADLFLTEGREHVAEMQAALHTLEVGTGEPSEHATAIASMFRAAHNIKGMAAAMDYATVTTMAHALETLLDRVRTGDDPLTPTLMAHLLDETDALARSIETVDAVTSTTFREPTVPGTQQIAPSSGTAETAPLLHHGLKSRHLRIDASRLDVLMTGVGELEIARSRLERVAHETGGDALNVAVTHVSHLIAELRDQVVTARMIPVGQIFERLPRLVRETAHFLNKDIDFVIQGTEIELDRSMLDEIGDPVMHLLRNAIDHGIETLEERQRSGKPLSAHLMLNARRESNCAVICVSDDGRGVDRERALKQAQKFGLVDQSTTHLDDAELLGVLTAPGFSTADHVTDISGRGVGLDVVNAAVRSLGGALDMQSVPGRGTAITMQLPLTIAIIHALLVRLGDETFALPMTHILEAAELDSFTMHTEQGQITALIRGESISVVHLRDVMGLPPRDTERPKAVMVNVRGRRVALVVDEFVGQQDVVVKRFDSVRGTPTLFGGATILNDGAPALIIDVNCVV